MNSLKKVGYLGLAVFASSPVLADPSATETAINSAFATGKTSYTAAVTGLIGLAAVGVAVGFIISMLRRS